MQNGNEKPKRVNQRSKQLNEGIRIVMSDEPLDQDEFAPYDPHPDIWGVLQRRFDKGYITTPIVTEHPKSEVNLSKLMQERSHFFEIVDSRKRIIACTTCELKHGGILDAQDLLYTKIENGVLFYKGKAINKTS